MRIALGKPITRASDISDLVGERAAELAVESIRRRRVMARGSAVLLPAAFITGIFSNALVLLIVVGTLCLAIWAMLPSFKMADATRGFYEKKYGYTPHGGGAFYSREQCELWITRQHERHNKDARND